MAVGIASKENIDEIINSETPVLLDFWREGCGPCSALGPVIEEVASERDDINFFKVNVSDEPELVERFLVMSVPSIIVIKNKEVKKKTIGYKSKDSLNDLIDKAIEKQVN